MSTRDEYVEKLKARLDAWNADIDALESRARKAQADAQALYRTQIEVLRARSEQAKLQLELLRRASEGAWSEMRAGMEKAWDDMGEAVKAAAARFR